MNGFGIRTVGDPGHSGWDRLSSHCSSSVPLTDNANEVFFSSKSIISGGAANVHNNTDSCQV